LRRTGATLTLDHARSGTQNVNPRHIQLRSLLLGIRWLTIPHSTDTVERSGSLRKFNAHSLHSSSVSYDSAMGASTDRPDSDPSLSLAALPTCQIADALVALKMPHGGHIPDILPVSLPRSGARICGPAYTVQYVPESDIDSPKLSTPIHWLDTVPAGSIVVIAAPAEAKDGVWGSLMSAAAQARSLKGVVISGRCRDVAEHRSLGFPVFAKATSILGPTSFTRPSQINVPLVIKPHISHHGTQFPSITVEPGDWIIADGEGVVCVPRRLEKEVMQMAENGVQIDELCNAEIRAERGFQKASVRFSAKFEA